MQEITKLISFTIGDTLVAVDVKVKIENEQFYIHDETKGWVPVDVSMMIRSNLMEP